MADPTFIYVVCRACQVVHRLLVDGLERDMSLRVRRSRIRFILKDAAAVALYGCTKGERCDLDYDKA